MRIKTQIILMSLLVLASILFIRSTSIFALPDDNCYCHDFQDAIDVCNAYCGFGEDACLACYLLSPRGVCNDSTYCQTTWRIVCLGDLRGVDYWQSTWCSQDCWLWVNQFWNTHRVEDFFPTFLVKAIKTLWMG